MKKFEFSFKFQGVAYLCEECLLAHGIDGDTASSLQVI